MYQSIYRSLTRPQAFLLLNTLPIGRNKTWELWTNSQLCFPSFPTISLSARPGNLLWGDLWFSLCLFFLCTYSTWCWEVIRLCLLYRLRLLMIKSLTSLLFLQHFIIVDKLEDRCRHFHRVKYTTSELKVQNLMWNKGWFLGRLRAVYTPV